MRRTIESLIDEVNVQSRRLADLRVKENTIISSTSVLTFLISYSQLNRLGYDVAGSAIPAIALGVLTLSVSQISRFLLNRNLRHDVETMEERNHQQISYQLANQLAYIREDQLDVPDFHFNYLKKKLRGDRGFGLLSMLPNEGISSDQLREKIWSRHNKGKEGPIDHEDVSDWLEDLESYHLTEKTVESSYYDGVKIVFQYRPTRLGSSILKRFKNQSMLELNERN